MVKKLQRMLRHLLMPPWRVATLFPAASRTAIASAIADCESCHGGQIRFAVEGSLHLRGLWHEQTARDRAVDVFSQLRIWDTADNNGVLVYLLLADRDVEIVADRGIAMHAADSDWYRICHEMERTLAAGQYESGIITGIRAVSAVLARYFPGAARGGNELSDAPVLL